MNFQLLTQFSLGIVLKKMIGFYRYKLTFSRENYFSRTAVWLVSFLFHRRKNSMFCFDSDCRIAKQDFLLVICREASLLDGLNPARVTF